MNSFNLPIIELSPAMVLFNIVFSFVIQLCIAWVYRRTHKGLSYSPSFLFTLVIMGVVGTMVMMVIQKNIVGALGLLGAFSLIRFRTILKETRDIAFVFFSLTSGVAVGTSNYTVAMIGSAAVLVIILTLDRRNFGSNVDKLGYILTFNTIKHIDAAEISKMISKYVSSSDLLQVKSYDSMYNYAYSVRLRSNHDASSLINDLGSNQSIKDPEIITGKQSVEY